MTSWFFIEMAAKSALICTIALLAAMALKDRAAADRAMVLRIGVGLLLALPVIALAFPALEIEAFAAPAAAAAPALTPEELAQLMALADAAGPAPPPSIWDDPTPLLMLIWAVGALLVAARLVVGLVTLNRWTRKAAPAADPVWLAALDKARVAAGASPRLRLLVADGIPGPLGWGVVNPVILIDPDTYAERVEAEAILAHEVSHVARYDWPALMLTRLATMFFWFNPLVWALSRELIQQAEEAADAHAARNVDPAFYAETLLGWAKAGRGIGVPANSIAPGARALTRRVRAVLEPRLRNAAAGSRIAKVAVLLCVGVAAPVAALELVEAARPAEEQRQAALSHPHPQAPEPPVAPEAPPQPAAPEAPVAPPPPAAPEADDDEEDGLAVLDRLPEIIASAHAAVDPEEIRRAVEAARRSQRMVMVRPMVRVAPMPPVPPVPHIDPAAIAAIRARVNPEQIRIQVRESMAHSRRGMLAGAEGMERGAAQMEAQARRFRDAGERERIIAEERARGRTVTHEDLIGAAEGMEEGARGMREGAREMRRSVEEMGRD
jgi:bla regulator protein blaR1